MTSLDGRILWKLVGDQRQDPEVTVPDPMTGQNAGLAAPTRLPQLAIVRFVVGRITARNPATIWCQKSDQKIGNRQ
jgi:hypothetical protein